MARRISAINRINPKKILNDEGYCGLSIIENKNLVLSQVAVWPDTLVSVGEKISQKLNLEMYPQPCRAVTTKDIAMLRIEPLKWWILDLEVDGFSSDQACILDISHSRTHLKISGEQTKVYLNRFLPIDLRENSFPINTVISTSFHHVSVVLWRSKNYYEIFIPRAFASSLWDILLESAAQFGYEIK